MRVSRYLTFVLALLTLIAFAANSVICRMALRSQSIGPLEFTLILYRSRISAMSTNGKAGILALTWRNIAPSLALFAYALFFSLAYIRLDASVGALILFAAVQVTMVGVSIYQGNRLTPAEWSGFMLALGGLIYLLIPGISAPPLAGAIMMLASGVSWGVYSLLGKAGTEPIPSTARNFLFCAPGCVLLLLIALVSPRTGTYHLGMHGVTLAVLSGGVTTGLGYVLWYLTLKRVTTTVASISQLAVPAIAGFGGVMFLGESLSFRMISASAMIIGGIVVTILGRRRILRPGPEVD